MPSCPCCDSNNVGESPYSPEEKNDGQGYEWVVTHDYYCRDCGCEWTETLTTKREVQIIKQGNLQVARALQYIDERIQVLTEDDRVGKPLAYVDQAKLLDSFVQDLEHIRKVLRDEE